MKCKTLFEPVNLEESPSFGPGHPGPDPGQIKFLSWSQSDRNFWSRLPRDPIPVPVSKFKFSVLDPGQA